MRFIDLTGKTFGRLTAISFERKLCGNTIRIYYNCICACGKATNVLAGNLKTGHTTSCGCYNKDVAAETGKAKLTTHGLSRSPEYSSWCHMIQRCTNRNHHAYKNYGGRGIMICDRWLNSFENFYADMGPRPKNHSLDRIDNNDGYGLINCQWATATEQVNNRRCNRRS